MADRNAISFEIQSNCGVISESAKGWKKELNLVSWNGRKAKYDIRDWSPDHEKLGKGITLSEDELRQLGELINEELTRIGQGKEQIRIASDSHQGKKKSEPKTIRQESKKSDISCAVDYDEL